VKIIRYMLIALLFFIIFNVTYAATSKTFQSNLNSAYYDVFTAVIPNKQVPIQVTVSGK